MLCGARECISLFMMRPLFCNQRASFWWFGFLFIVSQFFVEAVGASKIYMMKGLHTHYFLQILSVITDFWALTHRCAQSSKGQSWMTVVFACLSVHLWQAGRLTVHQQHLRSRLAPQSEPGVLRRGETTTSLSHSHELRVNFTLDTSTSNFTGMWW